MAQSPEEETQLMRRFAELQARLIGYEIAITAIIGALDRTGALPLAAAKSAIEAAAAGLASEPPLIRTEPLAVLRSCRPGWIHQNRQTARSSSLRMTARATSGTRSRAIPAELSFYPLSGPEGTRLGGETILHPGLILQNLSRQGGSSLGC